MHKPEVSVIGSGVAGIASAIRLAVKGFPVTVFEKNNFPGGKLSLIIKDGFHFDSGPSLFTQPENIEELFEFAGVDIRDYFSYQSVMLACRYFFENGKVINAFTDPLQFADEMEQVAGEDPSAILAYLKDSATAYGKIGRIFLDNSLHLTKTWLNKSTLGALRSVKPAYLFSTLDAYNRSRLRTPEAVQIFNRFATYNGSNPFEAPGMLSMISHLEHNQGVFYPQGGMISITNALYQLALNLGVKFHFNSEVESILTERSAVKGIKVNGESHHSSVVISNADVYFTFKYLLKNEAAADKILRNERSSSALIFYWGIKREFPDLHLHNIFFTGDYRNEFDHLFRTKNLYHDPTVYINITSKMEPGHAPAGMENWFVMVNAPSLAKSDWKRETEQMRERVIHKMGRMTGVKLENHIVTEEVLTPALIESGTGSYMGSLYGTSSNSKWAAFLRHPNFNRNLDGLYFAGGSVHPGGGIPLCLKSANITTQLIHRKYGSI